MIAELIALHLGALHPYEKVLTFGLAFGPFIILGIVIAVRRRQDEAADAEGAVSPPGASADRPEPPARRP